MVVTLKNVADRAGVSVTTVSRVLNGRESGVPISEETRLRILAVAAELGYRPNMMARALRGSHSALLGVLAQNISSRFHSQILLGIDEAAVQRGYRVFLGHMQRQLNIALDYGSMFEQYHADGIVIVGELRGDFEMFEALASQHRYMVTISERTTEPKIPSVYADSEFGTRLAMDHLWNLGHRSIACMTDPTLKDGQLRAAAYERYLRLRGCEERGQVIPTSRSFQASFETGQQFFAAWNGEDSPTAIYAATDSIAIGLLQAAFQMGITVPSDISIIGFDDIDYAAFTIPPLTTIRQSGIQLGQVGANLLIDMIENQVDRAKVEDVVLTPTLVTRQSTKETGSST